LGVINALGLRPWRLIALVLSETLALALVAIAVGVPLGLGLDAYLIWHGIDVRTLSAENVSMMGATFDSVMRGEFHPGRVVEIALGLVVIALLAAIWPALRAARLKPVAAMRAE
ncbi:MAG: FtsX-like permease family protein, partial [Deltaproteobacteria bacterium]|nr:FtsX-like permease family protein [Deltaproteobacteria bacterium]